MIPAAFAVAMALAAGTPDTGLVARVESLLGRGHLTEARRLAQAAVRRSPDHPAALLALGRTYLEWPVVGRFRAWRLFEEAARQAPTDPEPRYWQMRTGERLGGVDGERLTRDAFFKLLDLDAAYRDMWAIWERLYRGEGHRRRAVRILEAHADPASLLRRAILLIELERYAAADSVLATLTARNGDDVGTLALRAQAAFEAGRFAEGERLYWHAVDRAHADTADLLWRQVVAIATPDEEVTYTVTAPDRRAGFYRGFWARREPDLATPANERLAEHFQRLRTARRDFALLFPSSRFHRSPEARALTADLAPWILARLGGFGPGGWIRGHSRLEDDVQAAGVGVDVRDLPEPDSVSRYLRHGFDGRGLLYLRFGAPEERLMTVGPGVDVEAWRYAVDGEPVLFTIARATSGNGRDGLAGGDFVLVPTSRTEAHNATVMLERDASALTAEVAVEAWVAFFRAADPSLARLGFLDVVLRPNADSAAIAVWDLGDQEIARARGAAPLTVAVREGVYRLGADIRIGGRRGRLRDRLETPSLRPGWLAVSSLLAGITADSAPDRRAMASLMPADRVIVRAGRPLTLYAEVYDLPDDRGIARYEVTYVFEPRGGGDRVSFSVPRTSPAGPTVIERLVVQPGLVPPGDYRLTLSVRDQLLGVTSRGVALDLTLR
jgi:tetratricopeptide (TPR) repeat protein